jgi:hypothetical protein
VLVLAAVEPPVPLTELAPPVPPVPSAPAPEGISSCTTVAHAALNAAKKQAWAKRSCMVDPHLGRKQAL